MTTHISRDITLRRRAIYTGLKPFFNQTDVFLALQVWEKDFSSLPTYVLNAYVKSLCTTLELKQQRGNIFRSLIHALEMPEKQLLADPGSQIYYKAKTTTFHERRLRASTRLDERNTIFVAFMLQLFSFVDEVTEKNMRDFLIHNLASIKTEERRLSQLNDWLIDKHSTLQTNYDLDLLQKLVHLAYMFLCEYCGPVKADQHLAQSIKLIEPLSIALKFKIHDLL